MVMCGILRGRPGLRSGKWLMGVSHNFSLDIDQPAADLSQPSPCVIAQARRSTDSGFRVNVS